MSDPAPEIPFPFTLTHAPGDPDHIKYHEKVEYQVNQLAASMGAAAATSVVDARRQFGLVDSTTLDQSAAVASFLSYMKTNGGIGFLPPGTIRITAPQSITDGTKPFWILGAGQGATKFQVAADIGTPFIFNRCAGAYLADVTIDCGFTTYTANANHALVALDCSNGRFLRVKVQNYKNTGMLIYSSSATTRATNFTAESCIAVGNGASSNNGISLANMDESWLLNCKAYDCLGNPGIGLQLKNNCVHSGIINGYTQNCDDGYSFGTDTWNASPAVAPRWCHSSNLTAVNCRQGVTIGETYDCSWNGIFVDGQSRSDMLRALGLELTSATPAANGVVTGVHIMGVRPGIAPVVLQGTGCTADIDVISMPDAATVPIRFEPSATGNVVTVKRVNQGGAALSDIFGLYVDNSTNTNSCTLDGRPAAVRKTIASDTITIQNPLANGVQLSTEGGAATDNLSTINGGSDGQIITLRTRFDTQDVTVVDGTIELAGSNMVLDNSRDTLALMYHGATGRWCEVSRSNNGA